jgi:hypothetical protein
MGEISAQERFLRAVQRLNNLSSDNRAMVLLFAANILDTIYMTNMAGPSIGGGGTATTSVTVTTTCPHCGDPLTIELS